MTRQNSLLHSYDPQLDENKLPNLRAITTDCFKNDENEKSYLELQNQAHMLTSLINGVGTAILLINGQGKVELTNRNFCSLFRLLEDPDELTGAEASLITSRGEIVFTDDYQFVQTAESIIKDRVPVCGQKLSTKSGHFYQRDFLPIWDDDFYLGYVWIYRDITESMLANLKLQSQQDFYEKVLDNIPAEIAVFNQRQEYMYVNPYEIKDAQTRSWLIDKTDIDLCFKKRKPAWVAARRQHLFAEMLETGGHIAWEEQSVDNSGESTCQHRKYLPVFDQAGNLEMAIGFSLDITAAKQAEKAGRVTEARYRDLFNYSKALILTHDLQGKITSANPAVCHLLNCTEAEILGQSISVFMKKTRTADFDKLYLHEILDSKKAEGEFEVVNKSGETRSLLFNNYLVGEGNSAYIIGFAQDITLRVKAERELKAAKKLTEDLAAAKTRFLAEMSHELRTPLNGILGISELLATTSLSALQTQQLGFLTESANNLLMIVNDVLDFEKISSGKLSLESVEFNVAEKLNKAFSCFATQAVSKEIELILQNKLPPDMTVSGDPFRLGQIINNLLGNAIKFTEKGSVVLTAEIEKKSADIVHIKFVVEDTGIGIASEQLALIFEPFLQGRSDISRRFGGSGLGLAISRQLVTMQQGVLQVDSKEGLGSKFSFSIPYQVLNANQAAYSAPSAPKDLTGKRILVAEDILLNQYIVRNFLESFGCIVATADNGEIAVDMLQKENFDLVLMDLQMPVMDGIEATARIRADPNPRISSLPIIALTANAIKGVKEECLQASMNDYITKPYKKEDLRTALEKNILARSTVREN